nr:carbohydrate ABC transporter permease [Paenibacillus bovis]
MSKSKLDLFSVINTIILSIIGILCLLPFAHVLAKSISSKNAIIAGDISFLPKGFQIDTFKYVIFETGFANSLLISVFITAVGTFCSLLFTVMAAYPLSKPDFKGRKLILLIYVFSMLFYGGIIPSYILMHSLGLINTVWSMIIPFLIVPFNLLVVKTFFEGLPESIVESAKIDGASNMRILFSIILPISRPVLATIGLFIAVSYWNDFFHPLLFISKPSLKPLQLYLYDMVTSSGDQFWQMGLEEMANITIEGVKATTIIAAVLPILFVYPFLQKHFEKGLTIGSVK